MSDPIPVRAKDCVCPGTPHSEGDFVYLAPRLTAVAGAAATTAVNTTGVTVADIVGALTGIWLANCIVSWDFLRDEDGRPVSVPINRGTIDEYLPWGDGGQVVAEKCDDLYAEDFLRPLGVTLSKSSAPGPTEASTSAPMLSGHKRRKPSKRSSQNGLAGSSYAGRG